MHCYTVTFNLSKKFLFLCGNINKNILKIQEIFSLKRFMLYVRTFIFQNKLPNLLK